MRINIPRAGFSTRSELILITLIISTIPSLLVAQQRDDFLRPFFGYYDSQSLVNAVGRATVAAGHVIPGKSSNPANLGLHRFNYIQANFQRGSFSGPHVDQSHTRIGGVYSILPVRVYQGSLVFGVGITRDVDFTDATYLPGYELSEEGGIYATEFGMAVEVAENLFVGGDLQYLFGSDELSITEIDSNSLLNPKYRGWALSVGFVNRVNPSLQIGASIRLPTMMWVRDKLTTWQQSAPEASASETWEYELRRPLTFHLGFALLQEQYNLLYELEWTDWQDLEFSSDTYFEGDVAEINREISDGLISTLTHHFGGVYHPPWGPVHFYAGYQFMPVQYEGVYASDRREAVSGGASYMLSQQFSVHGSYSHYYWKYSGRKEAYGMLVFGVSGHY